MNVRNFKHLKIYMDTYKLLTLFGISLILFCNLYFAIIIVEELLVDIFLLFSKRNKIVYFSQISKCFDIYLMITE